MRRSNRVIAAGCVIVALMMAGQVKAGVVNGSFEGFFTGWTTVGPNTATTSESGVVPTDLSLMSFIGTGNGAIDLAIQGAIVDFQLGLPAGTSEGLVRAVYPAATEGATLFQQFTLGAGDFGLEFDWNFLSNEPSDPTPLNDFGFYALIDSANAVVTNGSHDLSSTFIGTPAGTPFVDQTDWSTVTIGGLTPGGSYTLIFGVFDDADTIVDSALLIDNIRPIPEPSAAVLLSLAALSAVGLRRRRA